jgi:hypothetical protein
MQKLWTLPGIAALVIGLLYCTGGPVWDDHFLILQQLPEKGWGELLLQSVGGGRVGSGYYRPVSMLALKGLASVSLVHMLAALLHSGSALLICSILGRDSRGIFAATVFAVHPLVSEPLAWASSLPDVLALHGGLWSVLLFQRSRHGWASFAILLGLLSKESAILPLLAWIICHRPSKRALAHAGTASALYLLMRFTAAPGGSWRVGEAEGLASAIAWPLASLAAPYPLTAVRDLYAAPTWILPVGLGVLLLLAALASRGGAWSRAGAALVLFGPMLALPPTLDGHLAAERYAYVSVAGLAWVLYDWLPRSFGSLKPAMVLAVVCLPLHWMRAQDWKDDQALFTASARALPSSSYAWHLLGYVQHGQGLYGDSAESLQLAIQHGHPHPMDQGLCLEALVLAGRAQEALAWAEAGPQSGLAADYIAWWARASRVAGKERRSQELFRLLRQADGSYDGPIWVEDWAAR